MQNDTPARSGKIVIKKQQIYMTLPFGPRTQSVHSSAQRTAACRPDIQPSGRVWEAQFWQERNMAGGHTNKREKHLVELLGEKLRVLVHKPGALARPQRWLSLGVRIVDCPFLLRRRPIRSTEGVCARARARTCAGTGGTTTTTGSASGSTRCTCVSGFVLIPLGEEEGDGEEGVGGHVEEVEDEERRTTQQQHVRPRHPRALRERPVCSSNWRLPSSHTSHISHLLAHETHRSIISSVHEFVLILR